uniref:Molybdopterin synthase sulfur carrier subunit n=1 Tax=Panagrolaimus davidi TaxID=227884 RepID=A0A914R0H6_9BILA
MTFDVTILLFGPVREIAGVDRIRLNVRSQMTSAEIIQQIVKKHPSLKQISSNCVLAVGQQYRHHDENLYLDTSTEIALIPPISGG